MTLTHSDIHDSVFDEIEQRIRTLQSRAPTADTERGAWTQEDDDTEFACLESDRALLVAHWKTQDGVVPATAPVSARACGRPQPCPHVLGLAQKYSLIK